MIRCCLLSACLFAAVISSAQLKVNTAWGNAGFLKLSLAEYTEPSAISLLNNDTLIVLCNTVNTDTVTHKSFSLVKLSPNGNVVSHYGANGIVNSFFQQGYLSVANTFCVSTDNKITVAGISEDPLNNASSSVCLKRFLSNGSTDSTFGNNGVAMLSNAYPSLQYPRTIKRAAGNKLLVAGSSADTSDIHSDLPMLMRLLSNGEADTGFGENGLLTLRFPGSYIDASRHVTGGVLYDVLELPDSSYLIAGGYSNSFNLIGFIAHVNALGNVDTTWMQSGYLSFDFSPFANSQITKLTFANNGEVWFSANSNAPQYRNFYGGKLNLFTEQYVTATIDFGSNEDVCNGIVFLKNGNPLFFGKSILPNHNSPVFQGDYFAFSTFNKNYFPIFPQPFTFTDDTTAQSGLVDAVLQSNGNVVSLGFQTNEMGKNQTTLLAVISDSLTSIPQPNNVSEFSVYPNPVTDVLNIESSEEIQAMQVADITGRVIIAQSNLSTLTTQLVTSSLAEATYFIIHIKTTSGKIAVRSFVKQ